MNERIERDEALSPASPRVPGMPDDDERDATLPDERVDQLGRPLEADAERSVAPVEAPPHHDQRDVRPGERSIGQDVRSSSQNGQGVTR